MDAVSHRESSARRANVPNVPLDESDPDFIAACQEFVKRSVRVVEAAPEVHQVAQVPEADQVDQPPAPRWEPAEAADSQRLVLALEGQIVQLREELATSQARIVQVSDALAEREALLAQGSDDAAALEDARRREALARQEVDELRRALTATSADREDRINELTQAMQREASSRTEVAALRGELDGMTSRYVDLSAALETVSKHDNQVSSELRMALTAVSDLKTTVEQLRLMVAQRDREIDQLRQALLEAEEARIADATAIIESFGK